MSFDALDAPDRRLLDGFQRDFPLSPRPFAALGLSEAEALARLRRLAAAGLIARVGAVRRPGAFGASTLAALAAPPDMLDQAAAAICEEPGVNHCYERENPLNLWFVATGPDRAHIDAAFARIEARAGREVVDLPLVTPYHIDLGFGLESGARPSPRADFAPEAIRPGDAELAQALCRGLALTPRPFAELGARLGRDEATVIMRIHALIEAGALTRFGVIVKHRPLGWRANAMVCFAPEEAEIDRLGARLAACDGVTLCYRRRRHPHWPYPLFCMIHGKSREAALETLEAALERAGLQATPRRVLFSTRCFKQRGPLVARENAA